MIQWRLILLPFAWIYGLITGIRNLLYDVEIFKSYTPSIPSICIGNLSVGGTGKTPHVAYINQLLHTTFKTAILSRGYGRKTTGYIQVENLNITANEIGDEPKIYVQRFFPHSQIAVAEKRVIGATNILQNFPNTEALLLDDAFQHRAIKAGLNIVLTDFNHRFTNDFMLPAGNLREWKIGLQRADLLIITKCPDDLTEQTKKAIRNEINFPEEHIYFSQIKYGDLIPYQQENTELNAKKKVLLVTGIANPESLMRQLQKKYQVEMMKFPDHHDFTPADIAKIHQKFDTFANTDGIIVSTEKDFVKLSNPSYQQQLAQYPWFYQAMDIEIDRKEIFNNYIINYVRTN